MEQKLSLQQKLLQKLSPQQIQVIKLLEIPTLQLEQRIKKELEENPVLELESDEPDMADNQEQESENENDSENEENSPADYLYENEDDEVPDYKLQTNNYSKDDKFTDIPFSVNTTFHENLADQVRLANINEEQKQYAEYIIGNIDEDGYLRRDLESISDDLAFNLNLEVSESELENILKVIHEFDPPGVGARDLQECLLIQLYRKKGAEIDLAKIIIKEHFEEFTKKHYDKIQKKLQLSDEELKNGIDQILKLNPKPGSSFSDPLNKDNQQIVPDFILEHMDGELILSLNQRNVPDLKINDSYLEMLHSLSAGKKNQS